MESMSEAFNVVSYTIKHHFKQEKPKSTAPCLGNLAGIADFGKLSSKAAVSRTSFAPVQFQMTDVSVSLPAKRRRGRPRKDGNLSREGSLQSPENTTPMKTQRVGVLYPTPDGSKNTQKVDTNSKVGTVDDMVGSMVYGVIEGSFDAGYLISLRIGNNDTPFRGVVFQPRQFTPVTASNDVAPQAKMYQRREIRIPVYDDLSQIGGFSPQPEKVTLQPVQASKQAVLRPILPSMPVSVTPYSLSNHSTFIVPEAMMLRTSSCSIVGGNITTPRTPKVGVNQQYPSVHPTGSLKMVEQDEVMKAFEVSTSSKRSKNNTATTGDMISESSFKATTTGLPGKESINHKPQVHGKAVESGLGPSMLTHNKLKGSNVELHHNFMEDMPRSVFQIQQDEMICREMEHPREFVHDGLQSPTTELQEIPAVAQIHSVPREPQAIKTEMQPTDLYYNELRSPDVNFHQDLFTDQSEPDFQEPKCLGAKFHTGDLTDSVSKSPNLKLDLASTVHEKKPLRQDPQASESCPETNYLVLNELKSPNLGYHQALVAGNPLLLPPALIGEPLEFMLEKPKSPLNNKTHQETNLELETRVVGTDERFHDAAGIGNAMSKSEPACSPSASFKLELATPQSTLNRMPGKQTSASAGCIADMDFVLSDLVQPTESHDHQTDLPETKHR
ncbi:hypothetical protein Pfo_013106 [Paulownia fortunei]|nr:hypothetical protein Pfo_013106 [Paulownia fortunei]